MGDYHAFKYKVCFNFLNLFLIHKFIPYKYRYDLYTMNTIIILLSLLSNSGDFFWTMNTI